MTTCGRPCAASASAIGRAMALVRHSTAIAFGANPDVISRAASSAIAFASLAPSGHAQPSTYSPVLLERRPLGRRSGLLPTSADAAATILRELRWLRPSVTVLAVGKARRKRSRLAREAPRNR